MFRWVGLVSVKLVLTALANTLSDLALVVRGCASVWPSVVRLQVGHLGGIKRLGRQAKFFRFYRAFLSAPPSPLGSASGVKHLSENGPS